MNRHVVRLIVGGKLMEKKNIDKKIIQRNLEHVILHFDKYSQETGTCALLKKIIPYTKNTFLGSMHLKYLYSHVVEPLLKEGNIDPACLPNLVHTFKRNEDCNYMMKKLSDYITCAIREGKISVQNDVNNWIGVVQVFSCRRRGINFMPLLRHLLVKDSFTSSHSGATQHVQMSDPCNVEPPIPNDVHIQQSTPHQCQVFHTISSRHLCYATLESLPPRAFCILLNVLSKVKMQNTPDSIFTAFLHENTFQRLPYMSNIDLCQLAEALPQLICVDREILCTLIEPEVLKRVRSFDILQLSLIFHSLSKYWEDLKKKHIFCILFMQKIEKYLTLYSLHNREEKYILRTRNKNTLIEIVPMFFLAYVKNAHYMFHHYFCFSKFVQLQFSILSKWLYRSLEHRSLFGGNDQCGVPNQQVQRPSLMSRYQHQQFGDDGGSHPPCLRHTNQTLSNLMYAFIGYLYNISTLQYKEEQSKSFTKHLHLTLDNINQLLSYFMLFYRHREVVTNGTEFILPVHKSQLLIFLYTYWGFLLDLHSSVDDCTMMEKKKKNLTLTVQAKWDEKENTMLHTADSFFFIKLENVKKISFLLALLDEINLNALMRETLQENNKYVSHIYSQILNVVNNSVGVPQRAALHFSRRVVGPYTISELCR
ncbi:conserved Plasmodium protein, unknown function [Plasmodium knowlesi strain H]|uniref:Uncharacterized protein n=3 Tax=Plasmodium knowlesi TaxID=5850 RepID=A0A5K1UG10_PLAKH|nr:conserved Plasmodium protein, unknown function [Plasmodium knowlesi strain H]OTN63735.1 Uncharacterized protein PKNOH_S140287300 [Plasmodium knowlesi]CAA9991284.1 conserved Plasmodium protein, unknown function [Plasmodium knowlesi strain H]SBO26378.1 conserved Plasmodium protein, unknown function [Plasmodium knowlesi strain H]SBO29009.1 conserved Plasmodium protein, unknown function [Plasmodium knowlesi strain H]VVS80758.1 conserved Plasmodium protein, unknown function [Plasmodium knowlesi |eukprot:XP_002262562.1 hypothetical protein, conserved in Plasmodium species [Plasmodium knowlesi strain H]